jgi:hypothetical protein
MNTRLTLPFYDKPDTAAGLDEAVCRRASSRQSQGLFSKLLSLLRHGQDDSQNRSPSEMGALHTGTCVAYHKSRPLIACSHGNKIRVLCTRSQQWLENDGNDFISSAKVTHIFCLKWMEDCDSLVMGAIGGIAIWRLYDLGNDNASLSRSWMQFLPCDDSFLSQPQCVHSIDICPSSRLCAAMTVGDTKLYVWDCSNSTATPLFCLDGQSARSVLFSPSGGHLAVGDGAGGMHMVDSYSWNHDFVGTVPSGKNCLTCWLNDVTCLFFGQGDNRIYSCEVVAESERDTRAPCATPVSIAAHPYILNSGCMYEQQRDGGDGGGDKIGIYCCRSSGNFMAVMRVRDFQGPNQAILPSVAIFVASVVPYFQLALVRTIESPRLIPTHPLHMQPYDPKPFAYPRSIEVWQDCDQNSPGSVVSTGSGRPPPVVSKIAVLWSQDDTVWIRQAHDTTHGILSLDTLW